ncbi:acyltransferase [Neisseria animalis]|nr:acyltransferase family protein [Neisseria animalis]ROW33355.1 hypothetical protein CGZ60_01260 [Neisseria animalis]VEE09104.1 Inner membrane protein YiaH [Neisseria animalis]
MNSRFQWADLCRIYAIFLVIVIHVSAKYLIDFTGIHESNWLFANLFDSFARVSVPLFFMLSGALLLNTEKISGNTLSGISGRIWKITIPLIFWSIIYVLHLKHYGVDIKFTHMLHEPVMYHLWFAYAMIFIYATLPFIKNLYENINKSPSLIFYLLTLWFTVYLIKGYISIGFLNPMGINYSPVFGYIGYFILGGLLIRYKQAILNKVKKTTVLYIFLLSSLTTFIATIWLSYHANTTITTAYEYLTINVAMAALSIFVLIFDIKINSKYNKILKTISENVFFIYFIHLLIMSKVETIFSGMPALIEIPLTSLLTLAISLVIAIIVRKIPKAPIITG